jgi:ABC-type transport system involved in multi-copper enzyme maturation permease subunit
MMLSATRLTYLINLFEIRAIVIATVLSVVVSAAVVAWLTQSGYASCTGDEFGNLTARCLSQSTLGEWVVRIGRMSVSLAAIFPFVAGLILGAPLVAREIDRGTARLSWSLSPSRLRWYVQRIAPVIIVLGVAAFTIGVVADRLMGAMLPTEDLSNSFVGFRGRGLLLATSALMVGSTAVALGAVIGRPMQTLLLSLVLGGLLLAAVTEIDRKVFMPTETVVDASQNYSDRNLYIDSRFQLPDGRLVTWEELVVEDPRVMEVGPEYPNVALIIPGERYRQVEAREALAELGIAALMLVAGAVIVLRRRPG